VRDDNSIYNYTRQEVDRLTPAQRERLFSADPEMAAWWRGKSLMNSDWPLFRIRGGRWLSKRQIEQVSEENCRAIWEIGDLLEWYVEDLVF
jgi:hypothetical protein